MADIGNKFLPLDAGPGSIKQLPVNVIPDAEWLAAHTIGPILNVAPTVTPLPVVPVVPSVQLPAPVVAAPSQQSVSVDFPNSVVMDMPTAPARQISGSMILIGVLLLWLVVR